MNMTAKYLQGQTSVFLTFDLVPPANATPGENPQNVFSVNAKIERLVKAQVRQRDFPEAIGRFVIIRYGPILLNDKQALVLVFPNQDFPLEIVEMIDRLPFFIQFVESVIRIDPQNVGLGFHNILDQVSGQIVYIV
jgi:hypothetical protein